MGFFKIIIIFILILVIGGAFIAGIIQSNNKGRCDMLCQREGGIVSELIPDGKWFSSSDYCVCHHKTFTTTWRLN